MGKSATLTSVTFKVFIIILLTGSATSRISLEELKNLALRVVAGLPLYPNTTTTPYKTDDEARQNCDQLKWADSNLTESQIKELMVKCNITKETDASNATNHMQMENLKDEDDPRFTFATFTCIFVTIMIVVTNCGIIIVAAATDAFQNFNKIFLYSMTMADLLVGVFITPYGIFLSIYRKWIISSDTWLCDIEAYTISMFLAAKFFSLTWLNVDHYIAVRKPERHNVMMSVTRSGCWAAFCWVIGISFHLPPLLSFKAAKFNNATFLCQAEPSLQYAYLLTAMLLVYGPAFIALSITSGYLFTRSFHKRISFYEKVFVELSTRPKNYRNTSAIFGAQTVLWTPFVFIVILQETGSVPIHKWVEFTALWLGLSSSYCTFLVFILLSEEFREAVIELLALPYWCPFCGSAGEKRNEATDRLNAITIPQKL